MFSISIFTWLHSLVLDPYHQNAWVPWTQSPCGLTAKKLKDPVCFKVEGWHTLRCKLWGVVFKGLISFHEDYVSFSVWICASSLPPAYVYISQVSTSDTMCFPASKILFFLSPLTFSLYLWVYACFIPYCYCSGPSIERQCKYVCSIFLVLHDPTTILN